MVLILAIVIGLYTAPGGFASVVRTDKRQLLFIAIGLLCLIFIFFTKFPDPVRILERSMDFAGLFRTTAPFNTPELLFIIMLLFINSLWQRSLATPKKEKIFRGTL